jgi:hypothetical protein
VQSIARRIMLAKTLLYTMRSQLQEGQSIAALLFGQE